MARSSPYSASLNLLSPNSLPSWVYGDDIGSLTSLLAQRDINAMKPELTEQQLESNRILLKDKQDQQSLYSDVADIFSSKDSPPSLRDAYSAIGNTALKKGMVEDYVKMTEELRKLDQEDVTKEQKKYNSIQAAAELAKIDPQLAQDMLNTAGVDFTFSPEALARLNKGRASTKRGKQYMMVDDQGIEQLVPEDDFNVRAKSGWRFKKQNLLEDMINEALNANQRDDQAPGEQEALDQKALVNGIRQDARALNSGNPKQISSGDIAPYDMTIRNPSTGEQVTIRRGQKIP